MSTFTFFPNRSKKEIVRLMEQSRLLFDDASKQHFAEQVSQLFDPLIKHRLSKTEHVDNPLQQTILSELCGLIETLPLTDSYFANHHKTVLDELIDACRWKKQIENIPFAEMAQNSIQRQADIRLWMTQICERPELGPVRRLTLMLTEDDRQAVAYRTLRAFLACLLKQKQSININTSRLFLLRAGRIELRINLVREYMFEQIALRVYLFHTTNEALFIEESLIKVRHWVIDEARKRVREIEPRVEEGINDIISQIKIDFINKCQRKKADPETFYLDAQLATYLFSFVKRDFAVDKLLGERRGHSKMEELLDGDDENGLVNVSDLKVGIVDPFEGDYVEEQKNIVRKCLKMLGEKCYEIIMRHFNNDFSEPVPFQTLAFEFGESAKTIESRFYSCLEKLKKLVNDTL